MNIIRGKHLLMVIYSDHCCVSSCIYFSSKKMGRGLAFSFTTSVVLTYNHHAKLVSYIKDSNTMIPFELSQTKTFQQSWWANKDHLVLVNQPRLLLMRKWQPSNSNINCVRIGTITSEFSFGCQPSPRYEGLAWDNENFLLGDCSLSKDSLQWFIIPPGVS